MRLTFRHSPRISRAHFAGILAKGTDAGVSPMAPMAGNLYDIIVQAKIDPALILAIWGKESQYGVTGIAPKTLNPGNVRTPYVPVRSTGSLNGFAVYPSWQLATVDLVDRLNLKYIARGLNTPETVFPVYAPPFENDTAGYIKFVNMLVSQWSAEDQSMTTTTGYADLTQLLTPGDNRPGDKLTSFAAFVIHETANENAGADAQTHYRYWQPGGGGRTVSSVHFVADAIQSIQLIPIDEVAWHAGDPVGNTTGVGIEICVNSKAGYPAACREAAQVVAKVLRAEGKTPQDGVTIRKHGSYPGTTHKQCPQHLNAGDWGVTWPGFIGMVNAAYLPVSSVEYAKIWGTTFVFHEGWGIETAWKRAAALLGAALSDEYATGDGTVTRSFAGGYIRYDPKTGTATSYLARPV